MECSVDSVVVVAVDTATAALAAASVAATAVASAVATVVVTFVATFVAVAVAETVASLVAVDVVDDGAVAVVAVIVFAGLLAALCRFGCLVNWNSFCNLFDIVYCI